MRSILSQLPSAGILIFSITGIVLGIILLVNDNKNKAKKILASYFFLCSIAAILGSFYYIAVKQESPMILDPITILCQSLILPILLLYARELFSRNWASVFRGVMVYAPIILYVVVYLTLWITIGDNPDLRSWNDFAENISNPLVWMRLVAIAISLFYSGGFISLVALRQANYNYSIENNYSYTDGIDTGWLKGVTYLFLTLTILFITGLMIPGESIIYIYAFLTWVIWIILFLKGQKQGDAELVESDDPMFGFADRDKQKDIQQQQQQQCEVGSSDEVVEDKTLDLSNKIIELLNDKKVYLNPDLSLQQLAIIAGSNRSYVSKVINETFKVNFFDLINKRRVEYATELLKDIKYNNYSLNFIGQLCGFKCDRTMYRAFVKFTGESPSKYRTRS